MLAVSASSSKIWERDYRNIFGLDTPAANYFDLAMASASERNINSIGLVYADTAFAREVAAGASKKAAELGITVSFSEQYAQSESDFDKLASRLLATGPDLILGASYLEDSIALTRAINQQAKGGQRMVFTVGPGLRDFGDELNEGAEGVMGVAQWLRSGKMPKAQDFSYRYKARFGYNAGVHAAMGYSAGQVLEAAARLAGSTEADAVRNQLATMKFRSLVGHYRVDESGKQLDKESYLLQWQDDRRRLILPLEVAEAPIRRVGG
jgi:branched-chain amino acid transport system substrate-binding protein